MAQGQASQNGMSLTEIMNQNDAILEDNDGLCNFLFPVDQSHAPRITQEMAQEVAARGELRERVYNSFLLVLKSYGFWRFRVKPLQIRLKQSYSEKNPNGNWLKAESPHHCRIERLLSLLRTFGLQDEADVFFRSLSTTNRITSIVSDEWRARWLAAMRQDRASILYSEPEVNAIERSLTQSTGNIAGVGGTSIAGTDASTASDLGSIFEGELDPLGREGSILHGDLYGNEDKVTTHTEVPIYPRNDPKLLVSGLIETVGRENGRLAQERKDYASALPSWSVSSVPSGLRIRPIFGPSMIPSPLAPQGTDGDWGNLMDVMRNQHSNLVAYLWDASSNQYQAGSAQIHETTAQLVGEGLDGLICYLDNASIGPANGGTILATHANATFKKIQLPHSAQLPPVTVEYGIANVLNNRDSNAWPSFQLIALENSATGTTDQFIINPNHEYFRVNNVNVEAKMLAGPLPGFAVIEFNNAAALWWRNASACSYTPAITTKTGQKRNYDEVTPDDKTPAPSSPKKRRHIPNDAWLERYNAGIRRSTAMRYQQQRDKENEIGLTITENLQDDDVVNGIAAFWLGLVRMSTIFCYGPTTLFTDCRTERDQRLYGVTACGIASDTFIMPLMFGEDKFDALRKIQEHAQRSKSKNKTRSGSHNLTPSPTNSRHTPTNRSGKGRRPKSNSADITLQEKQGIKKGHHLLVIARRSDPQHPNRISVSIMDSSPGYVSREDIRTAYKGLITNSGWLGIEKAGLPKSATPEFISEDFLQVPRQSGGDTCGLYTILNAWAVMLGIPVHTSSNLRRRSNCGSFQDFLREAVVMVDLAMGGNLDADTVQAFMNVYGYCVEQDVDDLGLRVRNVQSARLMKGTLADKIGDMNDEEAALQAVAQQGA